MELIKQLNILFFVLYIILYKINIEHNLFFIIIYIYPTNSYIEMLKYRSILKKIYTQFYKY